MLDLINHVVQISSRRDRTEINSAIVDALQHLFHPREATIYRCYTGARKPMVYTCAAYGAAGKVLRNAYLPDKKHCFALERDALLQRCRREKSAVLDFLADGSHRVIFPIMHLDEPIYMIDLTLSDQFSGDERVTLMGLIEYFGNHINLLDYGETDTLTGLASRKTFDKHLFELLGQAAADPQSNGTSPSRRRGASDAPHWLAVCDIDHFKQVNDTFGHLIGDEVLIMLAQAMRRAFRFDDQLFRFGGEEFIALLQPTDEADALAVLERFRSDIEEQPFSRVGRITISIGLSALRSNDTPTDVIDRADEALYFIKHHGRNQVACYEQLVADGAIAAKEIAKGEVELF
ncbi:MAG: GGDEF domain-containing protein [Dechloromonas agitata]|uniref:diguanylate cyclase n=1 Tax=Dechloromonas agitata TaxID=73030 RepID=A0A930BT44_9RHOO|nr:GGDEF domain-containing protein [Dechloromonas agitata]